MTLSAAAVRLGNVRESIGLAARLARRDPAGVTLIAVSKRRTTAEIEALIEAGQLDFAESRVQEAADKWPVLRSRFPEVRLHMVGQLQSNKAVEAASLFDTIHSLDRRSLLDALAATGCSPPAFVQVNIGEEEQKGGVALGDLIGFLEAVRASPVSLAGLMAIPPLGLEPGPFFALLSELAQRHGLSGLSMGMSSDYPAAVMLGATIVRVGTALFED
ncbi:MAG TPA: YggS family pyridoxal phosphate-dependent enzyme [Sphingomicrobium sp.]|nr:YggS family pyridoxal phosphate-dependent enzyme [Sphingomicrobium sp.]